MTDAEVQKAMLEEIRNAMNEQRKDDGCVDDFNTLQKIQKAKLDLMDKKITMTGRNDYNNYDYFELSDIKRPIMEVLQDNDLLSRFIFTDTHGKLRIYSSTGYCEWQTPLRRVEQKASGKDTGVYMKSEQAVQTYARRTLWLQAMEIEENNVLEQSEDTPKKQKQKPTKQTKKQKPLNKTPPTRKGEPVINQTTLNTTTISEKRIKEITDKAYNFFTANTNGDKEFNWENAQFSIRKFCDNDDEYEAVRNSVTFQQAKK